MDRPRLTAAAAALCLASLAACPKQAERAPSPTPTPSESVPAGGEIKVAFPWEPATLNPFVRGGDDPAARMLARPLLPALWRIGPHGERSAWLAEAEPQGDDVGGTPFAVRVHLRSGAVWSDGRPITASDVRFTWRTIMDPRWPIASRDGYDRIADVVAESPSIVRIVFSQPFARWHDLFAAGLGVLPEHALGGKDFGAAMRGDWPVSGGPFVLARYTRGLEAVYERNARYWGDAPKLDRMRVQFVADATTAVQLYRAGQVDALGPYSAPDFARRAAEEPRTSVSRDTGATWVGLVFNTGAKPLSDVRVRSGVAQTLDRSSIESGLIRDEGEPLEDPFVAAGAPGSFRSLAHDSVTAGRSFDAAGFPRSGSKRTLTFSLASVGDDLGARVLRAVYQQLLAAGVEVNLVTLEDEQLWRDWLGSSRFEAALVRFVDAPGSSIRARYASSQAYPKGVNYSRLADAPTDSKIDAFDRAQVPTAGQINLAGTIPAVPLYRVTVSVAARTGVSGITANASADGMFAFAERIAKAA